MNMTFDLTQITLALIALVMTVLTSVVIPWVKLKIDLAKSNMTENQQYVLDLAIETAVKAAEQIYHSEEGQKKKAYVLSLLKSQGYEVDSEVINASIEAWVKTIHEQFERN